MSLSDTAPSAPHAANMTAKVDDALWAISEIAAALVEGGTSANRADALYEIAERIEHDGTPDSIIAWKLIGRLVAGKRGQPGEITFDSTRPRIRADLHLMWVTVLQR